MGVTVTFIAILELVREGLIEIVQTEPYAPLHVRGAQGHAACGSRWTTTRQDDEALAEWRRRSTAGRRYAMSRGRRDRRDEPTIADRDAGWRPA